ncbi:NnrU family protein [Thalassolituus sp.]|uniref:NnrU family protein n=1 Tax=Thalassolituus sp. TaxID=2030822 RepID=UPI003513F819|nr:MAG: hypothetical protein CSH36_09300 [Thalassolituus sp.]
MTLLLAGILLFVGGHSINLVAPKFRLNMIERLGLNPWKGIYSVVAGIGLACLIFGYGEARAEGYWLWNPPLWTKHLATLLIFVAVLFLTASHVPGNRLQVAVGHPMYLGIKIWAFAHLLANGTVQDLLLFGSLLIWGVFGFTVSRRRDRQAGITREYQGLSRDVITLVISVLVWAGITFWLHQLLIGVAPVA